MNRLPLLFIALLASFAAAWLGLVFGLYRELGGVQPVSDPFTSELQPRPYTELELAGRDVYRAEGCIACHTQHVRGGRFNADIERGWGPRRSHPIDYIHDRPILMGRSRTGPDLVNIGAREARRSWHHLHLYDPRITSPGSNMPTYRYLYRKQRIGDEPDPDALMLAGEHAPPPGYEVVPTDRARALVAYLLGLDRTYPIPGTPRR